MSAITSKQETSIKIWAGLTLVIWIGYLVTRLTVGGSCERPSLVENFDKEAYLGRWYEMYRVKDVPFQDEDCATATYVDIGNNYIEVNNIEWNIDEQEWPRGNPTTPGKAQASSFRSGLLQVKFFELSPWSDYSVLHTDYTTHSVVYACDTFGAGAVKLDWLWVVTRVANAIGSSAHTTMKNTVYAVINSKLEDPGDLDTRLRPTEQTTAQGCKYSEYPL